MSDATGLLTHLSEIGNWDDAADVVVVGLGSAGSCAAIEAAGAGVSVLVVEKAAGGGGTTMLAAAHIYMGGGTPVQRANGIEDSVEDMYRYLLENTPDPDPEKIRLYCEQSTRHFAWLEAQGVPFNNGFWRGKHVMQPTDECLIWSGNEKAWPFRENAKPAPRGHKVARAGEAGPLLMDKLIARVEALGVRIDYNAAAQSLVVDDGMRIRGITCRQFGATRAIAAKRAVILAAGGFVMNESMLSEYCPRLADPRVIRQGNPNDDGLGIRLGIAAGGTVAHMDGCLITSPFYPPESLLKGMLVNRNGERFIAEDVYHSRSTLACLDQPGAVAYLICDNAIFGRPEFDCQPLIDAWESVGEMEAALELPAGSLQTTLAEYNEHAARGEDPRFHKHPDWLQPLIEAPYAALDCSLGHAAYMGFTLGGLRTSVNGEVLDAGGLPVGGLYAAGACASNIAQDGAGYSSGTCIGEGTFFGRRAGRHAATGRA